MYKSTHHLVIMQQFCAIPKPGYTRWFISLIGESHVIIEEKIIWLKFKVYVFRTNVSENSLKITHSIPQGNRVVIALVERPVVLPRTLGSMDWVVICDVSRTILKWLPVEWERTLQASAIMSMVISLILVDECDTRWWHLANTCKKVRSWCIL